MTREDALEVFNHQQAAWNARDPEALARDYADDGTIISPIFRTVQGKDAIVESFRALFTTFPDWQYTAKELLVDGDTGAETFVVQATHAREFMGLEGSGRKFEIQGVRIFKLKDGVIAYERRYVRFHRISASARRPARQAGAAGHGRGGTGRLTVR